MHGKLKDNKKQQAFFPGPGSYDPNSEVVMQSAYKVGTKTGQRNNFVLNKFNNTGPGSYSLNSLVVEKMANKYSIGNGLRFSQSKNTYEPGNIYILNFQDQDLTTSGEQQERSRTTSSYRKGRIRVYLIFNEFIFEVIENYFIQF